MLTLFHAPNARSTRILWLLEELKADYAIRYVTIRYGDGSGEGPDAANPHPDRKVPAVDHDGEIISESTALAIYLSDLLPEAGLAPPVGEAGRGTYLTWMCWSENELASALIARMMRDEDSPQARAAYDAAVRRLDDALARGPYLLGERFTAVDVMVGGLLGYVQERMALPENLASFLARLRDRPAYTRMEAKNPLPAVAA